MLERAFNHCHPSARDNRARVLQYLLPVKMLIGQLPTRCINGQQRRFFFVSPPFCFY